MNKEQLEYLLKEMLKEALDTHYIDMWTTFQWYTGWWCNGINIGKVNRNSGWYAMWQDKPYIDISREEFCELIGWEYDETEEEDIY